VQSIRKRELLASVDLLSLVNHRESCTVSASAAAAAGFITDAGNVIDVSIIDDF